MPKFASVLTLVCLAVSANADTIVFNDGFNDPPPGVPFTTVTPPGPIGPWTVGGVSVDWIGSYWQPAEGDGSIDMSGLGPGILTTTLNTVAGQTYILSFYLAGNPDNIQGIKTLLVQVGSLNQQFTFDSTGHSANAMGWVLEQASFVALGNDTLAFQSLTNTSWGPALDGVQVAVVPEPATYTFALLGLAAFGLFRRRR